MTFKLQRNCSAVYVNNVTRNIRTTTWSQPDRRWTALWRYVIRTAAVCLGHNTATLDDIVITQVVVVHNVRYDLSGRKLTDGKLTSAWNLYVYLWHGSFRITRSYIIFRALILFLPGKTESVDVIVDILDIELEMFRDISSTWSSISELKLDVLDFLRYCL